MSLFACTLVVSVQVADTLSLTQALTRAETSRPLVAVAEARVARARGTRRVAGVVPNPSIQLDFYDSAPLRKMSFSQGLSWIPRRGAELSWGRAIVDRARADSTRLIAGVGREVRYAFFGALAGRERRGFALEQRAVADSLVLVAERRLAAGDISALERDQVVLEAGRTVQIASRATEEATAGGIRFAQAIAWTAAGGVAPAGALDEGLTSGSSGSDRGAVAEAPELLAAIADSAAAAARLRSARLAQVPLLSLRGGREWGGAGDVPTAFLGFSIGVPIWSQGRELVAEAAGTLADFVAVLADLRIAIAARVDEAQLRLESTASRALLARDSLAPAARRIRAGAVRLYVQGQTGILPVFDAVRAEREVVLEMVDALLAYQQARADLLAVLGRWR